MLGHVVVLEVSPVLVRGRPDNDSRGSWCRVKIPRGVYLRLGQLFVDTCGIPTAQVDLTIAGAAMRLRHAVAATRQVVRVGSPSQYTQRPCVPPVRRDIVKILHISISRRGGAVLI